MRTPFGASLVAGLLGIVLTVSGCQDETGEVTQSEPTPADQSPSPEPDDEEDKEPLGKVDFELVELLTETAVGGEVDPQAIPLGDVTAVQGFSQQFRDESIQARLIQLVNSTKVPDGKALYAAVVSIGCDIPPGVVVTSTDSGLQIKAQQTPSPKPECVAAMTSVALVLVDESVVG